MKKLFVIITLGLIFGSFGIAEATSEKAAYGSIYGNPKTVDWKNCSYGGCFYYSEGTNKLSSGTNVGLDLFMPDGTCNVKGLMNPQTGVCSTPQLIISSDNFTNLKTNVAAMTVTNIQSTSMKINSNYCPIAYFTVTHEDGYFYIIQNVLDKVFPNYCYRELGNVTIPEFAQVVMIIMAIAILIGIVVAGKKMWNFKP